MSFGGRSWAISSQDMSLGPVTTSGQTCAGAIFDLNMGSNIPAGSGPTWVIGATFLVSSISLPAFRSRLIFTASRKTSTLSTEPTLHQSALLSFRQLRAVREQLQAPVKQLRTVQVHLFLKPVSHWPFRSYLFGPSFKVSDRCFMLGLP
jgi:hypothetical protein